MKQAIAGETIGSFLLFATVVGSGIMAENLAGGNVAVALLGNTVATGAMLFVLITMLGPVLGAHFNPVVTMVMRLRGEITSHRALAYVVVQVAGGIMGVWAAHVMFGLPVIELSTKSRTGIGQWVSEGIATFGLILTILGTVKHRHVWVPPGVAFYIVAAYWFTSSTSFANPAITIARAMSNTFAGIAPAHVPGFIAAQIIGALIAHFAAMVLFPSEDDA